MAKATKLTLTQLATFAGSYVASTSQANDTYTVSTDNVMKAVDKIGKQVILDQHYEDKLSNLDAEDLPLGKTIEEMFIDLAMPSLYGSTGTNPGSKDDENAGIEGAKENVPYYPNFEDCAYSYPLGTWKVSITRPYDYVESGCNSEEAAGRVIADIVGGLQKTASLTRFNFKKQLLANLISKAVTAGCKQEIAKPVDALTAEAFIKAVKQAVRDASYPNEGNCLAGANITIGSAEGLDLYILKDVAPVLEVDALAGCFNQDKLALPASIIEVDTFGNDASGAYAVLVDNRVVKFHRTYLAVRSKENAEGDWVKFVRHENDTAFLSKYGYVKVFLPKSE